MSVEIKAGQLWRDKDKRREAEGTVREFVVTEVPSGNWVKLRETTTERKYEFHRRRFGSGRANDSLELVPE